jgi:hypothetical protein
VAELPGGPDQEGASEDDRKIRIDNMNREFPIAQPADFPAGLRCAVCHREIDAGQPFGERFEGVHSDGEEVVTLLVCVYCE